MLVREVLIDPQLVRLDPLVAAEVAADKSFAEADDDAGGEPAWASMVWLWA